MTTTLIHPASPHRRDVAIVAGLLVLLFAAVSWFVRLTQYKSVPGPSASAPLRWPAQSALRRDAGLPTLVLFAHPKCPCTSASLSELRAALSGFGGRVQAIVAFSAPVGAERDWQTTGAWQAAREIPGVVTVLDPDGAETARFGAKTSGHVVLYGAEGALLFSGGITASRGHEGDNPGRARVRALLEDPRAAGGKTPVFGCELVEATR